MTPSPLHVIVLAAGKGSRMRSALPKVMHPLAGFPMLRHVLHTAREIGASATAVVVAPGMDEVAALAKAAFPGCAIATQETALGTGHAVLCAGDAFPPEEDEATQLVLYGDTPLIRPATIQRLLARLDTCDVAVLGMRPADPKHYGRLVVNTEGWLEAIVEWKDASDEQRAIGLCHSGVMALRDGWLFALLAEVGNANANGEYYLTDVIALAREHELICGVVEAEEHEMQGVNTRAELAAAEAVLQTRLRQQAMEGGATLIDPSSVFLAADTVLGRDVVIEPHVFFGPSVRVEDGARIRAFSHLEGAEIGASAIVGPYARLRPGTVLGDDVHIGNFVEIKNATLGPGAKANHLSYVGDAGIGAESNIGAGTITCNYDGFEKHRTEIGERVFIGSNTALVAPVKVGDGAIIGAGSTITRDVAAGVLAVSRAETISHEGGAEAFREMKKKR